MTKKNKNSFIDFVGNEVHLGEEVIAMVRRGERSKELVRGLVVDITSKRVKIYTGDIDDIDIDNLQTWRIRTVEFSRCIKLVKQVCISNT